MDTNLHVFPLPEQEAVKLNKVAEDYQSPAAPAASQRVPRKTQSSPWSFFGLVAAATLTGLFFVRRRA